MSTTPGVSAQILAEPVARKSEVKGYVLDVDAKPVENLQESSGSEISVWGWKNCKRWMKMITHHGILVVLSTCSDKPIWHHGLFRWRSVWSTHPRIRCLTGCDLVLIPAGMPRKPGMTRDDLFKVRPVTIGLGAEFSGKSIGVCLKIMYPYTQWFCWSLSLLNGYNWGYTPFSDIPI